MLLDTHVLQWLAHEPEKLSRTAASTLDEADELAVAAISWFELALLARRGRITHRTPIRSWLDRLAGEVLTIGITPAIADTAASLRDPFPRDPADRLIYATAIEHGLQLVTKDNRMLRQPGSVAVW